jgi:flavin reductase (DIM6/NTAB) family NADH-FMN oxidoreductase RutF
MQVISMVTPRPIAFISSQDAAGTVNVSPYSYFNVMAHDPIHITIGSFGSKCLRGCLLNWQLHEGKFRM